jgi:hypothetical protein
VRWSRDMDASTGSAPDGDAVDRLEGRGRRASARGRICDHGHAERSTRGFAGRTWQEFIAGAAAGPGASSAESPAYGKRSISNRRARVKIRGFSGPWRRREAPQAPVRASDSDQSEESSDVASWRAMLGSSRLGTLFRENGRRPESCAVIRTPAPAQGNRVTLRAAGCAPRMRSERESATRYGRRGTRRPRARRQLTAWVIDSIKL